MIPLILLCLSTTLFAAEENEDTRNSEAKILMSHFNNLYDMACQVPLQTLNMAKGAMPARIHWLLQQEDTYLAEKVSAEERAAALEHLEWQAHKNYEAWVREHDCSIMSRLACAIGCPTLLGMGGGNYVGGKSAETVGWLVGLTCGTVVGSIVAYRHQPDQTEIHRQIARLKAVQEKKKKTE